MKVAIVDDERDMRQSISQWLALSGYETETFDSARAALAAIGQGYRGVVLTDIRMPEMDGMALLKRLMHLDSALPVVMVTGHGDVPMAVEAMRLGAYDFLEKPFDPDHMAEIVRTATAARTSALENRALRSELAQGAAATQHIVGTAPAIVALREDIVNVAQADGAVLVRGETGTGKTLVARALHAVGARAQRPFVQVFLAGRDAQAQHDDLFGEGGALDRVRDGILVLEDVQATAPEVQGALLARLGDTAPGDGPRIISTSGKQDGEAADGGVLRPDLYHRLAALTLDLPPLRARGDDILKLFTHFGQDFADEYGTAAPSIDPEEAAQMLQAPWPGNVRQLINLAERAVLTRGRGGGSITSLLMTDNEAVPLVPMQDGKPLKEHVEAFERMLIEATMRRHNGAIGKVMEDLSLPRRTLNEKMAKYGLQRGDFLG